MKIRKLWPDAPRSFLRLIAMILSTISTSGLATAGQYYCPRGNLSLELLQPKAAAGDHGGNILPFGGSALRFPRSIAETKGNGGDLEGIGFKLEDCSDRTFFCVRVVQINWDEPRLEYELVIPRIVRPMQEYSKDGVRITTRHANATLEDEKPLVQATLWQQVNGEPMAMELTVHPKRGVVFWDGVRFTSTVAGNGELCLLVSENGLFSGVKVHR